MNNKQYAESIEWILNRLTDIQRVLELMPPAPNDTEGGRALRYVGRAEFVIKEATRKTVELGEILSDVLDDYEELKAETIKAMGAYFGGDSDAREEHN